MESKKLSAKVGAYCRVFRIEILNLSLIEFSEKSTVPYKNIHAFEYGRANNIKYLYDYYQLANDRQKRIFSEGVFNIL